MKKHLYRLKSIAYKLLQSLFFPYEERLLSDCALYAPQCGGSLSLRYNLTKRTLSTIFRALSKFSDNIPCVFELKSPIHSSLLTENLERSFSTNYSDKSTRHQYQFVYSILLESITPAHIVEIGLGTNNTSLLSNMTKNGGPGASLYAFNELFPNARISGGDIDCDILFNDGLIKTYYVNQLDPESLTVFMTKVGKYDIMIDDGLHSIESMLNTIYAAIPYMNPTSALVVEDIVQAQVSFFYTVAALIKSVHGLESAILHNSTGNSIYVVLKGLDLSIFESSYIATGYELS